MHKKSFLSTILVSVAFFACSDESNAVSNENGTTPSEEHSSGNDSVDVGPFPVTGIIVDSRDGKQYNTSLVGNQIWMAENLKYEAADASCVNSDLEDCQKCGMIYTWKTAKNSCPEGWHLPSEDEFEILLTYMINTASSANDVYNFFLQNSGCTTDFWSSTEDASSGLMEEKAHGLSVSSKILFENPVEGVKKNWYGFVRVKDWRSRVRCLKDFVEE
ncbi:MAG: hypothetical protein MJY85_02870 [Fibrobacter sp.]|nr:hypothetical protein [Fibrobacter sp.]